MEFLKYSATHLHTHNDLNIIKTRMPQKPIHKLGSEFLREAFPEILHTHVGSGTMVIKSKEK